MKRESEQVQVICCESPSTKARDQPVENIVSEVGVPDPHVNGKLKDAVASDSECAAECLAVDSCAGYAYAFDGHNYGHRCFVYGAGVEAGLPGMDDRDARVDPYLTWHGTPFPDTGILWSSGLAGPRGVLEVSACCLKNRLDWWSTHDG